jgi:hypothetical protein
MRAAHVKADILPIPIYRPLKGGRAKDTSLLDVIGALGVSGERLLVLCAMIRRPLLSLDPGTCSC